MTCPECTHIYSKIYDKIIEWEQEPYPFLELPIECIIDELKSLLENKKWNVLIAVEMVLQASMIFGATYVNVIGIENEKKPIRNSRR